MIEKQNERALNNDNRYYYRFARHCGILTLFYRAIFNGLRASNENSGPNVTFEPAKLGFKQGLKAPAESPYYWLNSGVD